MRFVSPDRILKLAGESKPDDRGVWSNVQIIPDGIVPLADETSLTMDQAAADRIIAAFATGGVALPVDIEHHTLPSRRPKSQDAAPAVGWVKSLAYEPDRGLVAQIEWTDRGRQFAEDGSYRYLSPVLLLNDEGEPFQLHSVALTNTPSIRHAEALRAASEALIAETKPMAKKKMGYKDRLLILQEEPGEMPGAAEPDLGVIVGQILSALELTVEDGKSLGEMLQAIRDAVQKKDGDSEGEGDAEAGEVAASIKEIGTLLALSETAKPADVVAAVKLIQTAAPDLAAMTQRIEAMEKEKALGEADVAVKGYVEAGKINPNNEAHLKVCQDMAASNLTQFKALMDTSPVLVAQGAMDTTEAKPDRMRVLSQAKAEYKSEQAKGLATIASPVNWMEGALSEAGMTELTDAEKTQYALA